VAAPELASTLRPFVANAGAKVNEFVASAPGAMLTLVTPVGLLENRRLSTV
jgi:hypothetical protein